MGPLRAAAIVVLIASALVSGCSSGKSTLKTDPAADLAFIGRARLTTADLPDFSPRAHTHTDDVPATIRKSFAECMKVPSTVLDDTAGSQRADSDYFTKDEASVSSEIRIYSAPSDADDRWRQIAKPVTGSCLAQLLEDGAKLGAEAGLTFGVSAGTPFAVGVGPRSIGYAVKLTLTAGKQSSTFYYDVAFAQRDRVVFEVESVDVDAPPDRAGQIAFVQKVYDRLGG
jgi:hypothetical protein